MSRIGKQPIPVPAGVKVNIEGKRISVKGPKGSLERDLVDNMDVLLEENVISVTPVVADKKSNAFRGLMRSLINNMVVGVDKGYQQVMLIEGVGYKANISGSTLTFNVGYSNPVEFSLPEEVTANVEGNNKIILESIDKELLGLTAAKIRSIRKPEPYKGKGIRYEGEYIARKVGKSGAK